MEPITYLPYFLVLGWTIYETIQCYGMQIDLRPRRLKKMNQTIFTLLILFMLGHLIILMAFADPQWSPPDWAIWLYYGYNLGLLKGLHNLRMEIQEET